MPHEMRDSHSGARLFIPTHSERVTVQSRKQLAKDLEDVAKLKNELEAYLDILKKKDGQS